MPSALSPGYSPLIVSRVITRGVPVTITCPPCAGDSLNAVSPGTIDNDFHRKFSTRQMLDGVVAATPLGRLGDSAECAEVILFLCSRRSSFIQGQIIEVNGGMLMV